MSQPTWTFLRFVNRVLRNLRKPVIDDVNDPNISRIAKDVVEITREEYQEICSRQDWSWLRSSSHLVTEEETQITGISLTKGIPGFGGATGWPSYATFRETSDSVGQVKVYVEANNEIYTVQPKSSSLAVTLDREYTGETGTSTITVFKDCYMLADNFGRFLSVHKYLGLSDILLVGIQEFQDRKFTESSNVVFAGGEGPRYATLVGERSVEFWPWPSSKRSVQYSYIRVPQELTSNDSIFSIPQDDITVLLHRVMMIMFGYIEDDSRAASAGQLYAEKYSEMSGSKTNIDDKLHIQVVNRDRAKHRRSRRGRYGSVDWGKAFDRWP